MPMRSYDMSQPKLFFFPHGSPTPLHLRRVVHAPTVSLRFASECFARWVNWHESLRPLECFNGSQTPKMQENDPPTP